MAIAKLQYLQEIVSVCTELLKDVSSENDTVEFANLRQGLSSGSYESWSALFEDVKSARFAAETNSDVQQFECTTQMLLRCGRLIQESKYKILEQFLNGAQPEAFNELDDITRPNSAPQKSIENSSSWPPASEKKHYVVLYPAILNVDTTVVGSGKFAQVYRGKYQGTPIAVKAFQKNVSFSEFKNEVQKLSSLRHPGIVQYMGCCPDEMWIVMEYMERGTLFQVLHDSGNKLTSKRKISMAIDVAEAMEFLHASKIRHCDLNSKNLLVNKEFKVKVADLGLSESLESFTGDEEALSEQLSKRLGTLRWMSTEMLKRQCKSMEKSDIWSFGIVMFEIGSQTIPYWDKVEADVKRAILQGEPPVSSSPRIWEEIPATYKDLMSSCWEQDFKKRPTFKYLHERLLLIEYS